MSISSVQFARPEEISPWAIFALELLREFYRPFLNLVLIVLFFFLVVRPILNWLKREVEPAGYGAQAAVLPDQPGSGPGFGDGLPLPLPPQAQPAVEEDGLVVSDSTDLAVLADEEETAGDLVAPGYDDLAAEEPPDYEGEEDLEEEETQALAYGNLSRDNVLPLAKDNIDRTVGLIRDWIEQKPAPDSKSS